MKLTKARRDYKCHQCKSKICRGDHYVKKTISIGSPSKETVEDGMHIMHGIRIGVEYCVTCYGGQS
jgi:hypothetical protein